MNKTKGSANTDIDRWRIQLSNPEYTLYVRTLVHHRLFNSVISHSHTHPDGKQENPSKRGSQKHVRKLMVGQKHYILTEAGLLLIAHHIHAMHTALLVQMWE